MKNFNLNFTKIFDDKIKIWHKKGIEPIEEIQNYKNFKKYIIKIHYFNFLLWHAEDEARRRDVPDKIIANIKRKIDSMNQSRNDSIEQLDEFVIQHLSSYFKNNAKLHSETIGSIIDRISILSLKIYHMLEQTKRNDVNTEHIKICRKKLSILKEQRNDLINCYNELIDDIKLRKKRIKVYYQFKMYNDPSTNPSLYRTARSLHFLPKPQKRNNRTAVRHP